VISPEKIYLVERNRISVMMRYCPILLIFLSPVATAWRYGLLLFALMRSRLAGRLTLKSAPGAGVWVLGRCAWSLVRAYGAGLRRIPADLRLRREWRTKTRVPAGTMRIFIRKYYLDGRSLAYLEPE
jgi:hypothetical protein